MRGGEQIERNIYTENDGAVVEAILKRTEILDFHLNKKKMLEWKISNSFRPVLIN